MPIGPRGERLPYPGEPGAGMGAGRGPDMPPQMPPIEAVVARIQELQAELQQLVALAEQMSGPQPGMGAGRGPDLPPGIPANGGAGIQATNAAMGVGGPPGLLG